MSQFNTSPSSNRRRLLRAAGAVTIVATAAGSPLASLAQAPKVTRIIVPYSAGGGTDILARHLAEALATELGSIVIVENRAGAGGNIGGDYVAKAAPDGSMLLMGDLALAVNPSLFKRMPFDPVNDLQPIVGVGNAPLVLVVNPKVPASNVKELVALAKSRPGILSFATAGYGNPPHIAGELFRTTTGVDILQIPYKGVGPALTDVLGGQVSMLFTGLSSAQQHIDARKVHALAVTGPRRARNLPQVPTMAEAGFPKVAVTSWWGLFGPAGMPDAVTSKIAAATAKVLRDPRLKGRLSMQSIEAWEGGDALALGKQLQSETERWRKVITDAKITAE
jgi:tripartite-type tricarboxylate transporter receptor subunit TctC